jgi:hypothetical protein
MVSTAGPCSQQGALLARAPPPDCFGSLRSPDRKESAPTPNPSLTEYPTASHAFDNPLGPMPPAVVAGGQGVRHCTIREEPIGVLINASTREPITYKDPCVETGPHVGYNTVATEEAKTAVREILRTVFALRGGDRTEFRTRR